MSGLVVQSEDWTRLTKLVGMMGSAHDGEATNAMRAAQKLLGRFKLKLTDVIRPPNGSEELARAAQARADQARPTHRTYREQTDTAYEDFRQTARDLYEEMMKAEAKRDAKAKRERAEIERAFDILMSDGGLHGFFRALKGQYDAKGYLTRKQQSCLFEEAAKISERKNRR